MKETILLKQNEVAQIAERMKSSASVVAFKYQGLTVDKFQELRKEMRANGCEVEVVKNNISRRAAIECGYNELTDGLSGPIALAFAKDDMVAAAKILFKAAGAENAKVEVVKGVVDGDVYSFEQLKQLSQLPSYETLLTQLAAGMMGTVNQLAIGLNMLVEQGQEA
jgi:large subunit ribosomal protein L10